MPTEIKAPFPGWNPRGKYCAPLEATDTWAMAVVLLNTIGFTDYLDDLKITVTRPPSPVITSVSPADGSLVLPDAGIGITIANGVAEVDVDTVVLTINGNTVAPEAGCAFVSTRMITVEARPPPLTSGMATSW